jgi:hypothetical protein
VHKIASNDKTFLSRVITDGGSWIYGYKCENKATVIPMVSPNSPRPKKGEAVKEQCQEHAHNSLRIHPDKQSVISTY